MKNIFVSICIILTIGFESYSQIYLGFESEYEYGTRLISGNDSLWQMAVPSKGRFDAAYSGNRALLTDSINMAGNSGVNIIEMVLYKGYCSNLSISFQHKYFTDSLHAGGRVEVSYNDGNTWINVVYDTLFQDVSFQNFYTPSDTIINAIPSFTGTCGQWMNSGIWLSRHINCALSDSIRYRFVFESDSTALPMEGWMIDDIYLQVMSCKIKPVSFSSLQDFNFEKTEPSIWSITPAFSSVINVCSMDGRIVFSGKAGSKEKFIINGESLPKGFYILSATGNSIKFSKIINNNL